MSQDWLTMTAAELGRGIAKGEIGPVALTQTHLDAIRGHQFRDRIYARLTEERALAEARAAEARARSGHRLSPLDGVPISWKDLFDTSGVATEAGTELLKGRVPDRDAEVLRNATAAGLVCLGKTHMSELAFSGLGYNPVTATPPCVNDHGAVAGGSSSGAAASVAFGLAPAAVGTDTGGSVRIPSAWNDLVGLKTTHGRLSLEGVVPLRPKFDTVGPLCRTVEDASLMFAALEDGKPADLAGATLTGARFLVLETIAMDDLEEPQRAAFESAVDRLSAAGARIERQALPVVADMMALAPTLFAPESYGLWKDVIEARPELMFSEVLERFRSGASVLASDYVAAWLSLENYRVTFDSAVASYDAVLTPTCPILPPKLDRLGSDSTYFKRVNLSALRNTFIGNLSGGAALTLPTGVPSAGLQLIGPPRSEERLLRLGAAAEAALT